MEEIVRSNDVVPATVGVLDGKIYIGWLAKYFYIPPKILSPVFFKGCRLLRWRNWQKLLVWAEQ